MSGTARVSGAGVSRPITKRSISSSGDSGGFGLNPSILRKARMTALANFFQPAILPPSTLIRARALWNSGLPNASATNSSKFFVPYTSPSCALAASRSDCNCLTSGKLGLAKDAEVTAWAISCRTVCTFIPLLASINTVFVAGRNIPAALRPTIVDRSPTT